MDELAEKLLESDVDPLNSILYTLMVLAKEQADNP